MDDMIGSGEKVKALGKMNLEIAETELKFLIKKAEEIGKITPTMQTQIDEARINLDLAQRENDILEKHVQWQKQKITNARAFGTELAGAIAPYTKSKYFNIEFAKKFWSTMTSGAEGFGKALMSFTTGIFESLVGGMIDMASNLTICAQTS